MKVIKFMIILIISLTTFNTFSQVTKKSTKEQKKKHQIIKKQDIRKRGKEAYPGVEWKPKQDNQLVLPESKISNQEMQIIDNKIKLIAGSEADLTARLHEAKRNKALALSRYHRFDHEIRRLKEELDKIQGTNNEQETANEQEAVNEERHTSEEQQSKARNQAEINECVDYDKLEQLVVRDGRFVYFKYDSRYLDEYSEYHLSDIAKALKVNNHARLVIGIKKKAAGLANARKKFLKFLLATETFDLLPKYYRVIKLNKKEKKKNWLIENEHVWFRLERI